MLSALACGILSFWVTPHMGIAQALYYDQLADSLGMFRQQEPPTDDGSYTMANFVDPGPANDGEYHSGGDNYRDEGNDNSNDDE